MKSKVLSEDEQTKIAIALLQALDQRSLTYDRKLEIIGTVLYTLDEALSNNGTGTVLAGWLTR